jgi:hypothetical protein
MPTVGREDRVAELDGAGRLGSIVPRRTVVATVPDHLTAEDERVLTPGLERRVLMHLSKPQHKESALILVGVVSKQRDPELLLAFLPTIGQQGLEKFNRHGDQLDRAGFSHPADTNAVKNALGCASVRSPLTSRSLSPWARRKMIPSWLERLARGRWRRPMGAH